MLNKVQQFWYAPLHNKLNAVGTFYYKVKGIFFYRFVFARFGSGSYIRKPLLILNPGFISVGQKVSIRDGARLEVVRSSSYRTPSLVIGDGTNIEQNVHIVCHCRVSIGSRVSITGNCSIADVIHPYENAEDLSNISSRIHDEDTFIEIGDGSFIGFGSVILPNVAIGKHVVIGANSVVVHDIPDYSVAVGAPAVVIKRFDFMKREWVRVSSTAACGISES
jgi:acetyltransferase-like isoleucine patch superfamily enzyme